MKGLHFVRARQPRGIHQWYVYAWRGGPLVIRRSSIRKPAFTPRELRNIQRAVHDLRSPERNTLASLISEWRWPQGDSHQQSEWSSLPPGTKRSWGRVLDEVADKWGASDLSSWDDVARIPEIDVWRGHCRGALESNAKLSTLRELLQFGVRGGRLVRNVAADLNLQQPRAARGIRIWTDRDIECFAAAALRRGKLHVLDGMRLALLTGLPRKDLVRLCWADIGASNSAHPGLALVRSVSSVANALDSLLIELRRRYRAENVDTVLVDSRGEPWTGPRYTQAFNRVRDAAAISPQSDQALAHKHLHDLRTTFCSNLIRKAELSDRTIASAMGWRCRKVASMRHALSCLETSPI